jgi:hypothetical protein
VERAGVDVNVVIDVAREDAAARAEQAVSALGLRAGWVTAAESRVDEPDAYDEALGRLCEPSPLLLPVLTLVPPTAVPGGYERARRITSEAVCRVVRLCPTAHRYVLADWVLTPLAELCDREGVSVLLDFAPDPVPWGAVVAFARAFPSVPMVVLDVELDGDRSIPAAMDAAPNVVCAITGHGSVVRLASFCDIFGAARFVCGSDQRAGGASVFTAISDAALTADARDAVLHGNADALARGTYAATYLS